MLKNYIKLAFRNLLKRKGYSFLNIFGLAIGIICCLLIFQYVAYEKSYDNSPEKAKDIVRLRLDSYKGGELSWKSATVYPAIGPTMKKDFPEVEAFCRLIDAELLLLNEERNVKASERKGYFADPSFLSMFNVQLISGNPKTALDGPDKLLLSETTSKKFFGNADPIGKRLQKRDPNYTRSYEVTGVFKDFPKNSHLIVNHLASYATLGAINRFFGDTTNQTETSWGWYDFYTYLQLKPGTNREKFISKFPAFCDKYINSGEWQKTNNVRDEISMIPLQDIHLYSNYNQEAEVNGNGQSVSFLFLIAFFIIGIAWINYINLATARSMERAKEIGVRKVMGALRKNLIIQFLVESVLLNLVALLLALGLVYLFTPMFNQITGQEGKGFSLPDNYWLGFLGMFISGSFLAGIYPAFVLSGFQPVSVLKGLFKSSTSGLVLRKGLIIVQFATSIILIAGTIIVYQQVSYMRNQSLGVNINQTLVLDGAGSVTDSVYQTRFEPFKNELLKIPAVKNVVASTSVMGREIYWTNGARRLGTDSKGSFTLYNLGIDYDFVSSFGLQMKAGRNFSKDFPDDTRSAVLLNETAAKLLGFADYEKAVTTKIYSAGDTVKVAGIMADYHHQGLQKVIDPMVFRLRPNSRTAYSIKIESANVATTISSINEVWSNHFPADPFHYYFLDNLFDQQYKADRLFGKVFGLFAFLAILIACFGLLGLSAYNVLQRTKEIGIRKVLGASVQHVLFILSKGFLVLVFVSFIIATPITWLIMHKWLEDFAYRISIGWWVFLVSGMLAILIAFITIGTQALKAAISNPVKSLRTE